MFVLNLAMDGFLKLAMQVEFIRIVTTINGTGQS